MKALITGITGQDGSYLAELLLEKGYEVHGIVRRVAMEDPDRRLWRIRHIKNDLHLHAASLESLPSLYRVFKEVVPDECYHLAAQSFVTYSFEDEFSTLHANINGTHHVLSALRDCAPDCHFYFAASSEMFGKVACVPQDELTVFHPRSSYGISKVSGYHLTQNYREAYGVRASCGILYNHESPRRGFEFVTRKISYHAAAIKLGLKDQLQLGNLEALRDWGHAREYVTAMWMMLQQDNPDDYVISTGEQHSVREFAEEAFSHLGLAYQDYVVSDPQFYRPAEVETLLGNATKAKERLGWIPQVKFQDLVQEMVETDLELLEKGDINFARAKTLSAV
ncbi:GDP-mannose 4,6-dehydratase [Nitrospira sp. M1]